MGPEKFSSLRSQIGSWLLYLRRTLSSFRVWAWTKLSSTFQAVRSRYLQYKANATQQEQSANNGDENAKAEPITHSFQAEAEKKEAKHNQDSSNARKKPTFSVRVIRFLLRRRKLVRGTNWAERTTVIVTIGILVAAGVQAYIYWQQWKSMQAQVEQTERSVVLGIGQLSAAAAGLKNSQRFFQIEQRPYIVMDDGFPQFSQHGPNGPIPEQKVVVNVQLKNIGKTPAILVVSEIKLFPFRGKLLAGLTKKERREASEEYISILESNFAGLREKNDRARKEIAQLDRRNTSPGNDVAPQRTYFVSSQEDVAVSKDDFPLFHTGVLALYAIGTVTYSDPYGNPIYVTEYCASWWGDNPLVWHFCDSHNRNR